MKTDGLISFLIDEISCEKKNNVLGMVFLS